MKSRAEVMDAARVEQGLNLRDLGKACGCSASTAHRILKGHPADFEYMAAIARCLGLDLNVLARLPRKAKPSKRESARLREQIEAAEEHLRTLHEDLAEMNGHG